MFKRLFDIVAGFAGLVFLGPAFLLIGVLIKLDTRGPVFYRGVRTGRFGTPFRIFKFRSMVINAEHKGGTTTGKDDPRVTRVGHFLRKYKLDELPQVINVLLGDMSLVGPRPEVQEYTDLFTEEEKRILTVRPGITDLASIQFNDLQEHVGSEDPDRVFRERILPQKNALRLKYVNQQTFWSDICILFKTVSVLLRRGSQGSQ